MKLNREEILKRITYDPLTGEFLWLPRTKETDPVRRTRDAFNNKFAGKPMGTLDHESKNRVTRMRGTVYYAKTLAFVIMTGKYPEVRTSYLDGDKTNLKWDNLCTEKESRAASKEREAAVNSNQVYPGVVYYGCNGAFKAILHIGPATIEVGDYKTAEAATEARNNKLMEMGL